MSRDDQPSHFKGKDALEHVIEAQAKGIITATEVHGLEAPGSISSGTDAARETAIVLSLIWLILEHFQYKNPLLILGIVAFGWFLWKVGRSAWLGWFRLERLHRVLEQERWEIEHHRQQERDELRELYRAKGFEGKLLEDVLDVLMADNDRLLKVMVEEELGLTLSSVEHPLKQGLGAGVGVICGTLACLIPFIFSSAGLIVGAFIIIALTAALSAKEIDNKPIPAIVWNLGIAILAIGSAYFLLEIL